jgi:hypothetical protein
MGYGHQNKFDTPEERIAPLLDPFKYNALYIIRNHLHIDLKSEYVMEEEPNVL